VALATSGNAALGLLQLSPYPSFQGPALSLHWVHDKGHKDHRFHEDQAQLPSHEHDSSSVHQRLPPEVGPQTCEKLVVLKIPVKEC
jgi:hypothetical protein